ncbi:nicotinate-nucleotide--dimethylbenzimidazole phosphoribosyltransferase, partial [Pseudomonas aeruginosa]|uniref:nicotinate-nucleotide--dimethylbenzimidazole phosphoribosyltransferase n=1 Tax=Pseudomonas aeruginosa TaxID=287 RepID=UPI002FE18CDA
GDNPYTHGTPFRRAIEEGLLDLGLRLGEGSGAALAVPLLRQACALHAGMATFAEAAVSDRPA